MSGQRINHQNTFHCFTVQSAAAVWQSFPHQHQCAVPRGIFCERAINLKQNVSDLSEHKLCIHLFPRPRDPLDTLCIVLSCYIYFFSKHKQNCLYIILLSKIEMVRNSEARKLCDPQIAAGGRRRNRIEENFTNKICHIRSNMTEQCLSFYQTQALP